MKIISYKKIKQNKYEVTLSNNESVLLYDDIILKYELLTKKEIDNQKLKEIILDNSKYDLYYAMLKDISKKFRTEKELRTKFKDYDNEVGYSERTNEVIEPLLSKQWFVNMKPIVKELKAELAKKTTIFNFYPTRFKSTLNK